MAYLGYTLHFEAANTMSIEQEGESKDWTVLEYSTKLLKEGIHSKSPNIMEPTLFYTCGYALKRLGKDLEGDQVFEEAAQADLFPSFWQRSPHFLKGLTSNSIWYLINIRISSLLKSFKKLLKNIR